MKIFLQYQHLAQQCSISFYFLIHNLTKIITPARITYVCIMQSVNPTKTQRKKNHFSTTPPHYQISLISHRPRQTTRCTQTTTKTIQQHPKTPLRIPYGHHPPAQYQPNRSFTRNISFFFPLYATFMFSISCVNCACPSCASTNVSRAFVRKSMKSP